MNLKSRLISKLRKEFPQVKFKSAKLITKGWDHDVLVLDNKLIFRFGKEKLYKTSFAREIKFLKEFSKISNLKVPNYLFQSKDKSFGGYEIIKGYELTPKIYKNLSQVKKRKITKDLAKFLTILHSLPLTKAKKFGFKNYKSWKKILEEKQKWFNKEYYPKMTRYLTTAQNAFIKKFITNFCNSQRSIKPVLGHYDLSHDHIIMNKDGTISGIIDFGDLSIEDPAKEFNGFIDYSNDVDIAKQIYKHYRGPRDPKFLKRCREHFIDRWIFLLYDGKIRRKNKHLWKEANNTINKIIKEENNN